ncbi:hypothetical protein BU14_0025s0055 [Porphyra umbilicalis]|uniref:Uncharacterized protein n=1 Tax=Porphyra umbilicalis TaxID=2786 RepID=A0A1X6PJU4_PORUM|nr:hypothetical protein BU14_0025s0055 [Porphyra umbilicalis]|eukprot:OSX81174.1 hypothetical protein BU14_0025s0055 [Porphyra umbilicalis]
MTGGAADHRLSIGYIVHGVAPAAPSPSRTPPPPRRGAVPRPPPALGALVVPPQRLPSLGGGGGSGGGGSGGRRSAAATRAPRLRTLAPVVATGVAAPAAAGARVTAADATTPRPTGWCRAGPPRPAAVGSPVTILPADVDARPDGWLTAARPAGAPTPPPPPPATAHGWRPYHTLLPHVVAFGSGGRPHVVPLPPPPHAPRRAVGGGGQAAVARSAASAVGGVGGGGLPLPRRSRHGRGAPAAGGRLPPRAGRVAKPRVECGRGCGQSFGNRSGTLAVGLGGGGCAARGAPRRGASTARPPGASTLDGVGLCGQWGGSASVSGGVGLRRTTRAQPPQPRVVGGGSGLLGGGRVGGAAHQSAETLPVGPLRAVAGGAPTRHGGFVRGWGGARPLGADRALGGI